MTSFTQEDVVRVAAGLSKAPPWHKRCDDCLTINGKPWCAMNCSSTPNAEKVRI